MHGCVLYKFIVVEIQLGLMSGSMTDTQTILVQLKSMKGLDWSCIKTYRYFEKKDDITYEGYVKFLCIKPTYISSVSNSQWP